MRDGWFRMAVVVTLLLSPLSASAQELGTAEIEIVPPNPTPDDVVSVKLSGEWPDSCTPRDPESLPLWPGDLDRHVESESDLSPDPHVLGARGPIGRLPAGTYEVTVRHFVPVGGPLVLGQAVFTIEAVGVGGVVTGLSPKRVVCWNLTTRKVVVIADGARSWD